MNPQLPKASRRRRKELSRRKPISFESTKRDGVPAQRPNDERGGRNRSGQSAKDITVSDESDLSGRVGIGRLYLPGQPEVVVTRGCRRSGESFLYNKNCNHVESRSPVVPGIVWIRPADAHPYTATGTATVSKTPPAWPAAALRGREPPLMPSPASSISTEGDAFVLDGDDLDLHEVIDTVGGCWATTILLILGLPEK